MDQVGIYNMALGRVGISKFVNSLTEQTNQRLTCDVYYENCRLRVLSAAPWNFATRINALADIGTPPNGWAYRYKYPADCAKARVLAPTYDTITSEVARYFNQQTSCRYPFSVVEDEVNNGKAIITNLSTPVLWYTADINNLNLWTPEAVSSLAWLLGTEIAGPLSAQPNYTKLAGDAYTLSVREAWATNANEETAKQEPESEFITVRY